MSRHTKCVKCEPLTDEYQCPECGTENFADDEPRCDSCNVPFIRHLGLTGTCAKLQTAEAKIAEMTEIKLQTRIRVLDAEIRELQASCDEHIRIRNEMGERMEAMLAASEEAYGAMVGNMASDDSVIGKARIRLGKELGYLK